MLKMDEDVILDKKCISELVKEAEKSEKNTFVGGKVFISRQRKASCHRGWFKSYYAIAKGIGVNEENHEKFSSPRTIDALNGCMVLISKKFLMKLVGLIKIIFFITTIMIWCLDQRKRNIHRFTRAIGYHDTKTGSKNKYEISSNILLNKRFIIISQEEFSPFSLGWFAYFSAHNMKFWWDYFIYSITQNYIIYLPI